MTDASSKTCTGCGRLKPTTEFKAVKRISSGFGSRCKKCVSDRNNEVRRSRTKRLIESGHIHVSRKVCHGCKRNLRRGLFTRESRSIDGLNANCRSCHKAYRSKPSIKKSVKYSRVRKAYNINKDQYVELLNRDPVCQICGSDYNKIGKGAAIDHDHETGKIRGILCSKCNSLLGLANDSIQTLNRAISYLSKSNKQYGPEC